jgi:preprotein translocase subunit SecG
MQQPNKSIKKSTWIILALLFLNVLTFSLVSSNIKHNYPTTDTITTSVDDNKYFKAGVNVLDWSYRLLRIFRR